MNPWKLIRRSLVYHRRDHFRIVLGTMTATAVLVGALLVGDSVRHSLRRIVFDRLGSAEFALAAGDRFFRAGLADELSDVLATSVAPVLQTEGIAVADGGSRRINGVQVLGVDSRFGTIGGSRDLDYRIPLGQAVVNEKLARRLGVEAGDEILFRIRKLDVMPRDAPLSLDADSTMARRFRIASVAGDAEFGKFSLRSDQVSPDTVFVPLESLADEMGFAGRANVLLVAERKSPPLDLRTVEEALHSTWKLADAGLELRKLGGRDVVQLESNRVFLSSSVGDAAQGLGPGAGPVLTYFVNELRLGERGTPYSFVSAPGTPIIPMDLEDDEIVINDWLAGDLKAEEGDRISLTYFVLGPGRDLEERISDFRVREVVPLTGIYADRDLLPNFPGLADQENCRDWNPGMPIDLGAIRDKDEEYWDDYRGTPKAFVTLQAARRMWANRFGDLTAVRFREKSPEEVEKGLTAALEPEDLGLTFRGVRKEGLLASSQSVNFAELFLGLSFFVIVAALLLTSLLFVFNTEKRAEEIGLLRALGFAAKAVERLVFGESLLLILSGGVLGSMAGILYNLVVIAGLKTVWRGAVGTSSLHLHVGLPSLLLGAAAGMAASFLSVWGVTRKHLRRSIAGLQRNLGQTEVVWRKRPRPSFLVGILALVAVVLVFVLSKGGKAEGAFAYFFIAGSLVIVAGVAWTNVILFRLGRPASRGKPGTVALGLRNGARKRTRSIALVGLLASGLFIVFSVGANRLNALKDAGRRDAGTGGFALFGESTVPVLYDLNSKKGREFYGLDTALLEDASFVQFRVKDGDDASCLNLNRVANPRLIGVNPAELSSRKAFTFTAMTDEVDRANPWSVLERTLPEGIIPAVADQSVIVWGLGKHVGDTLDYTDEKGGSFRIKLVGGLANSVFQGNLIVSESAFLGAYPSTSGYRLFLVDTPPGTEDAVAESLSWSMQDQGVDVAPAARRLAEFNTIQNTYLSIFLVLGSFGLFLGSLGLGIVVARNIGERRGEMALLRAVGFSRKDVRVLVLAEHLALVAAGLGIGIVAAFIATLPSLLTPGAVIPYPTILIILILIGLNGGLWTAMAAAGATRGDLLPALRNE